MEVNVEQGDIILRHTKGWSPVAWGIRKLTESYWNHVGQIMVTEDGAVFVIEAQPPVVVKTPIAEFINPKKFHVCFLRVRQDAFKNKTEYKKAIAKASKFLIGKIGSLYDKRAIIWLAISYTILGMFKRVNPLDRRKEFFCSELVCRSWHGTSSIIKHLFAGIKHPGAKCNTITPGDIRKTASVKYIAGKDLK